MADIEIHDSTLYDTRLGDLTPVTLSSDDFDDASITGWTIVGGTWTEVTSPALIKISSGTAENTLFYNDADAISGWDDYTLTIVGTPRDNDDWGVVFRVQDRLNYYLTRWNRQNNTFKLYKVVNGSLTELAADATPTAYTEGVEYTWVIVVSGTSITVDVNNGTPVSNLSTTDGTFSNGSVGMNASAQDNQDFSSVVVNDGVSDLLNEDFTALTEDDLPVFHHKWASSLAFVVSVKQSDWQVIPINNYLRQTSNNANVFIIKDDTTGFDETTITVKVAHVDDDGVGIVFRYTDTNNYYEFLVRKQTQEMSLNKMVSGTRTVIANRAFIPKNSFSGSTNLQTMRKTELKVTASGTSIKCYVDGELIFNAVDSAFSSGKIGLKTDGMAGAHFFNFKVTEVE